MLNLWSQDARLTLASLNIELTTIALRHNTMPLCLISFK